MNRILSQSIHCLVFAAVSVLMASCSTEPATEQNAENELIRVLDVWKTGDYYLSPTVRMSQYKEGKDVRRFFENRLDAMSLDSFEVLSQESTEADGEFKFTVRLTVTSNTMSVMNPVPPRPQDTEGTYYVYQGRRKWVVESGAMRAAKQALLGE
jgi:hypothetical protein